MTITVRYKDNDIVEHKLQNNRPDAPILSRRLVMFWPFHYARVIGMRP